MNLTQKLRKPLNKSITLLNIQRATDQENKKIRAFNRKNKEKKNFLPKLERDYPFEVFENIRISAHVKRNLEKRTAEEWVDIVEREIPHERRSQVCCIILWDYFGASEKRHEAFYKYTDRMELQTQERTVEDLVAVGYPIYQAFTRCFYKESPSVKETHESCLC